MRHIYHYEMIGTAADGQTWTCCGDLETANAGEFAGVPSRAMRAAFDMLTEGKAVYGKPGLACRGPYSFKRMVIEDITHGARSTEEMEVVMPTEVRR